jgi:hypothetical protein
MKKINVLFTIGVLFLATSFIVSSGCKKTADPTPTPSAPSFLVTAIPYSGDNNYLEFYAACVTDDILLTKVTIKDPLGNNYVYTAGQQLWVKDEYVTFPDVYLKQYGTWRLTFVGNKSADGSSFTASATVTVTGK